MGRQVKRSSAESTRGNKRVAKRARAKTMSREPRPNWLPDGWIVEVGAEDDGAEVKYYISPGSGSKFRSKKEVLHFLQVTELDRHASPTTPFCEHNLKDRIPEWLPHGWILEIRTRLSGESAGQNYKCYLDPSTGSTFYSKAEVLQFLELEKCNSQTSGEKGCVQVDTMDNVLAHIEYSPEGLPQGWIKETKFIKSKGDRIRRDVYYTDLVSGYVFRSLRDATHYVETGELGKHMIGPTKRSFHEEYSIEKESPPPSPLEELLSVGPAASLRLFAEEAPPDGDVVMDVEDSHEKLQLSPPGRAPSKSITSSSNVEHLASEANKRNAVSHAATDKKESGELLEPVNNTQKSLNNKEENKALLEPIKAAEKQLEEIKAMTPTSRARKQVKRRETVNLPRRLSKRLAGLEPAPITYLELHRASREPKTGAAQEPQTVDDDEVVASPEKQMSGMGNSSGERPSSPVKHMVVTKNTSEERPSSPVNQAVVTENTSESEGRPLVLVKHVMVKENTSEETPSSPVKLALVTENTSEEKLLAPVKHAAVKENTSEETPSSPVNHVEVMENICEERPPSSVKRVVALENASEEMPLSPGKSVVVMENSSEERPPSPLKQVAAIGDTYEYGSSTGLVSPFGDCWPDPCIEFAVKTLLGEIPLLEEGIPIEEYVQKQLGLIGRVQPNAGAIDSDNKGSERGKTIVPVEQPTDSAQHLPAYGEGMPYPLGNGLPSARKASGSRLNP